MNHAIEVENLNKYCDKFQALDHINLNVKQGQIFGFRGPNGARTTTTRSMLTRLLTSAERRILLNGHDLPRDSYPAKRQIGLVPEESNVTGWLLYRGIELLGRCAARITPSPDRER